MPPSDNITCKSLFQLDSIFYNASYALKSKQPPILKLPPKPIALPPRVFPSTTQDFHNIYLTTQKHSRDIRDEKPIALPPRVFPSTTKDFHNIYLTTQKHRRDIRDEKPKNSPKKSPLLSPSPKLNSNPLPSTCYLDNTDSTFTNMNLPSKLQHLA